jgi:hypothetical protein
MAIFSNNVSIANDGELIGGGVEWQSVKTASYTASAGEGILQTQLQVLLQLLYQVHHLKVMKLQSLTTLVLLVQTM